MGCSQSSNKELEKARYEVDSAEIVVHGAEIACKYGSGSRKPNYLLISNGHGLMEDGKNCAHDGNCIPMENIYPFEHCTNPDAKSVLTALAPSASGDFKERCNAALKVIKANEKALESDGIVSLVPCALPLLDRWFDANEKEIVTYSFDIGSKIVGDIKALQKVMSTSLQKGETFNRNVYYNGGFVYTEYTLAEREECLQKSKELKIIKDDINDKCSKVSTSVNTEYLKVKDEFNDIVDQLNNAKEQVDQIKSSWVNAQKIYSDLDSYNTHKKTLEDIISYIDTQIEEINELGDKEYYLITTDSFLVCRCGEVITIKDSGQKFETVANTLVASILEMITQFKDYSRDQMEKYKPIYEDEPDQVWSSHNAVVEGLGYFENMLMGNGGETNQKDVCIYIELICHSYNDEMKKAMMSCFSLLGVYSGVITWGLVLYTFVTMMEDLEGAVSGTLACVDAYESWKYMDDKGILTQLGAGTIGDAVTIYNVATSLINFFYVSYETWIENIKLTIFTDTYAHTSKRRLTETGKLVQGENFHVFIKDDYILDQKGDGLKWKEEPGVYLKRMAHKGENISGKGAVVNGTEDVEGSVVYQ